MELGSLKDSSSGRQAAATWVPSFFVPTPSSSGTQSQQPSTPAFKKQQERDPATSSLGSLCSQLHERTCGNKGEEVWRWNISIILKGDFAL